MEVCTVISDFLDFSTPKFQNFILGGSAHNRDIGYNWDSSMCVKGRR